VWVYLPSACFPAQGALILRRDGQGYEQSRMWSATPTPKASSYPESEAGILTTPLSGTMLPPSTGTLGAERWISSLEDSPAKMCPTPENAPECQKEQGQGFGASLPASFAKLGPDSSWLKMFQGYSQLKMGGGLGTVLRDLAQAGYDAEWRVFSAADAGAPHLRERVWITAYWKGISPCSDAHESGRDRAKINEQRSPELRNEQEREPGSVGGDVAYAKGIGGEQPKRREQAGSEPIVRGPRTIADSESAGRQGSGRPRTVRGDESAGIGEEGVGQADSAHERDVRWDRELAADEASGRTRNDNGEGTKADDGRKWWQAEPPLGRVVDGLAYRVDRLRCCGNGVVPQQALPAFEKIVRMAK